jgi:hypothetical protein
MIIPSELQFTAERLMKSNQRVGTADNDINAIRSMGMVPQGYVVNNFLTDPDAFFIKTDVSKRNENVCKSSDQNSYGR